MSLLHNVIIKTAENYLLENAFSNWNKTSIAYYAKDNKDYVRDKYLSFK